MRPLKRQKTNVEKITGPQLWTLDDCKALLEGLKSCHCDDYRSLQKFLPDRTATEIKAYIQRRRLPNSDRIPDTSPIAPIEVWTQKSEQLQKYDSDHSRVLGQVLSTIATLEPHSAMNKRTDPNYSAIYMYLAALLKREMPPPLGAIDAAILMDILDGLAGNLKFLDTQDQQAMMRQKYKLLRDDVTKFSPRNVLVAVKKRLKEDAFEVRRQETTAESAEGLNGSTGGGATASEGHCEGHLVSQSDAPGQVKRAGGNVSGKKTKAIMRPTKDSAEQETTDVCSSMAAWYCVSPFCIDTKYLNPNTTSAP